MSTSPEFDFIAWMRQEMHAIAQEEARKVFNAMRPGGNAQIAIVLGDGVTPLVADASIPIAHIDMPYPAFLEGVNFRSHETGSATLDIKRRRPTQTYASAVSIIGSNPPSVTSSTDAEFPKASDWTDWIESDSTLYIFLTSVTAFTSLTLNLIVRGTTE